MNSVYSVCVSICLSGCKRGFGIPPLIMLGLTCNFSVLLMFSIEYLALEIKCLDDIQGTYKIISLHHGMWRKNRLRFILIMLRYFNQEALGL